MAKKIQVLSVTDIILSADAETIQQALDKRIEIDSLLAERREIYQRIAELEQKVDEVIGESESFPFPAPPLPIATFPVSRPSVQARTRPVTKPVANAQLTVADEAAPEVQATSTTTHAETAAENSELEASRS